MVWEASKAYVRGKLIAQTSKRKKEHKDTIQKLEAELSAMERELARHYSDSLFNDICKCKFKIHEIFNKKAEYALFRLKTSRLLARQLKEQSTAHVIPAIRSEGSLVTSSKGINEVFQNFYEKLYRSSGNPNKLSMQTFFMNINLANLSPEQVDFLDKPVTWFDL